MLYPFLAFGRFKIAELTTNVNNVDQKDRLTIYYREHCSRCKKILPKLILEHGLSFKKFNVINANKLNSAQLEKAGVRITPVFRLNGKSYNTVDQKQINKIWQEAK